MAGKRKISEEHSNDGESSLEELLEEAIQKAFEELENFVEELENASPEHDEEALSLLTKLTSEVRHFAGKLTGPSTK